MTLLEFLDRRDERRTRKRQRPPDTRAGIGLLFLAGYYVMVYLFMKLVIPAENVPLVRDAMLVLGPGVGLIVGALFRSDVRDEIATNNSGEFARAIGKQADATTAAAAAGSTTDPDAIKSGDNVTVQREESA